MNGIAKVRLPAYPWPRLAYTALHLPAPASASALLRSAPPATDRDHIDIDLLMSQQCHLLTDSPEPEPDRFSIKVSAGILVQYAEEVGLGCGRALVLHGEHEVEESFVVHFQLVRVEHAAAVVVRAALPAAATGCRGVSLLVAVPAGAGVHPVLLEESFNKNGRQVAAIVLPELLPG